MLRRSTPFEVLISGRPAAEVRNLARTRSVKWLARGLYMRTTSDRITARVNEISRFSVAPTMKGRIAQEPDGTRIVGRINWTVLTLAPVFLGIGAICFGAFGLLELFAEGYASAVVSGLGTLVFGAVAMLMLRMQEVAREGEELRLRQELLRVFSKPRP